MSEIQPLIASPSPRDIVVVKKALDKIPVDKLIVKYYREKEAYKIIRDFFLEHKEYTHCVICPDDLVVTDKVFQKLKSEVERTRLPVLAGICNLSWNELNRCSFCMNVSGFNFVDKETLPLLEPITKHDILQVGHEGFACTFISREVMEEVSFEGMNEDKDAHFDWAFSLECARLGIPLHVYLDAKIIHLKDRRGIGVMENWGVGIKPPATLFNGKPFHIDRKDNQNETKS